MAVGETWCPFCHLIRLYFETVLGAASYKIGWFWNFCYVVSELCKAHAVSVMNFEFVNCSDQLPMIGLFMQYNFYILSHSCRCAHRIKSTNRLWWAGPLAGADFIQGAGPLAPPLAQCEMMKW